MPTIQEYKHRVLSNYDLNGDKQRYYDALVGDWNFTFVGVIDLSVSHTIKKKVVNKYLRMVINIPTMAATDKHIRRVLLHNVSYCMTHQSNLIHQEVKEVLEQYFDWLKERDDYVDSELPEEKKFRIVKERIMKQRIIDRTKLVKQELIETLYHPDRYMKMVASYGEVWADIHMP